MRSRTAHANRARYGAPRAGTARALLPLSDDALLAGCDLKLVLGVQSFAGTVGRAFPNASSLRANPELVTRNCTAGCVFNLTADPAEAVDLGPSRPDLVANLTAELAQLKRGFFENHDSAAPDAALCADAPPGVPCACHAALEHWGGFFGPYQMVDF